VSQPRGKRGAARRAVMEGGSVNMPNHDDSTSIEELAMAGGFDENNPCPQRGAWPAAPGDGSGRVCVERGWSWLVGCGGRPVRT
jgi:hypothetical protein